MTRATDDLQDGDRFRPLGAPVRKPATPQPEWAPVEGSPGIERNRKGELRTNLPLPKEAP